MNLHLDAADARTLPIPDHTIDLIVTSPPYYGLRDYGTPGEIGSEPTITAYIHNMNKVLTECARVLKPERSLFIVIGDKYARTGGVDRKPRGTTNGDPGGRTHTRPVQKGVPGIRDKSLLGLPFRIAINATENGWIWRQEIVWHKTNPIPESVTDRSTRSHETILHLTRKPRYYTNIRTRTPDIWQYAVGTYRDPHGRRHPAIFPVPLITRIIEEYCPPQGVVLDPFMGSGTTPYAAISLGRHAYGFDLNPEYVDIARTRLDGMLTHPGDPQ